MGRMLNTRKNKVKNGYTLMEVIIGVTIFSIFFSSILYGFSTLVQLEIYVKKNCYETFEEINEISKKYYRGE